MRSNYNLPILMQASFTGVSGILWKKKWVDLAAVSNECYHHYVMKDRLVPSQGQGSQATNFLMIKLHLQLGDSMGFFELS